jgi:hypothetical protein
MKAVGGFEGDNAYVAAGMKLMETYKKMAETDLAELSEMMKRQDKLTNDDIGKINKIIGSMNEQPEKLNQLFNAENKKLLQKNIPKE